MNLKNGRSAVVACDGQMLMNIIRARGFEARELSEMMGYEKSYFGKVLERNKIGTKAAKMLDEQFGIKPQQYGAAIEGKVEVLPVKRFHKSVEEVKKSDAVSATPSGLIEVKVSVDMEQIKALIKQAVKEAYEEL